MYSKTQLDATKADLLTDVRCAERDAQLPENAHQKQALLDYATECRQQVQDVVGTLKQWKIKE